MPAYPPSKSLRWMARSASMPSLVLWSMPRRRPAAAGSRRSRFAASHARAWARKASRDSPVAVCRSVAVSLIASSSQVVGGSQVVDGADPLAVPGRLAVEGGVGRQPAQVEVLVVVPRVPDPTEDLPAVLGEIDARVADVGLGDARHLPCLGAVVLDGPDRGSRHRLARLEGQAGIGELVLDRLEGA